MSLWMHCNKCGKTLQTTDGGGDCSCFNSCDIARSAYQMVDAHGWIMIDCPFDGGIIFSDRFLSALKAQLSEHETEEESTS